MAGSANRMACNDNLLPREKRLAQRPHVQAKGDFRRAG